MKESARKFDNGSNLGHATYSNSYASLLDYRAWQRRCLNLRPDVNTEEEYLQMLDSLPICRGCRYAEDKNYTNSLRLRIRQLETL
jgi:hypothetical protein